MTTALFFMILAVLLAIAIAVNAIRVANKERAQAEASLSALTEVNAELRQDLNDVRLRESNLRVKAEMFRGSTAKLFYECFIAVDSTVIDPNHTSCWPELNKSEIANNGMVVDLMHNWRKEIRANCQNVLKEKAALLAENARLKETDANWWKKEDAIQKAFIEEGAKVVKLLDETARLKNVLKGIRTQADETLQSKHPSKNEQGLSSVAQAVAQSSHLTEDALKRGRLALTEQLLQAQRGIMIQAAEK